MREIKETEILVKFIDSETEAMIRALYVTNPSEILKCAYYAKEFDLDFNISPNYDSDEKDKYDDKSGRVSDIIINTGGNGALFCIKIYLTDLI